MFHQEPKSKGADDLLYRHRIRYNILNEAFQQDFEANRLNTSNNNILLSEIQRKYSRSGNIEEYRIEARGMDMKDDRLIEFVGNIDEDTIKLTDKGRTYFEEHKRTRTPYTKLDL